MPKINPKIQSMDDLLRLDEKAEQKRSAVQPAAISKMPENGLATLSIGKIRYFINHPFRLYDGERLDDMVESVKAHGVLTPAIVRRIGADENDCEYEMLAGHNRMNATRLAGLTELPCVVKENLSDEDAWIYVIETNVLQRSFAEMLPSEKAAVLAMQYSKMFSQGKRNDIIAELKMLENPQYDRGNSTCGNECHKLKNREKLGGEYGLAGRSVANYVRVYELSSDLKIRLDDAEFTIVAAVELSYLTETEQQMVETVLMENEFKVNEPKAKLLRGYTGKLNAALAYQVLSGEKSKKPKSTTPPPLKIKHTVYTKHFSADTKPSDMERVIDTALTEYFERHKDGTITDKV